jgi:hypothetical protein
MKYATTAFILAAAGACTTADAYPLTPFTSPITITNRSPMTWLMMEWSPSDGFRHRSDGSTDVLYFTSARLYTMGSFSFTSPAQIASGSAQGGVGITNGTLAAGTVLNSNTGLSANNSFNPTSGLTNAYFGISYMVSAGNYNYGWIKFSNNGLTFILEDAYMNPTVNAATTIGVSFFGVVDFADWMSSVNNQHRTYNTGVTLASLPLEGAHHRPMMSFDRMGKDTQYWATGDFGSSSRVRDVKVTSGEVGVNKDIGPNTLAGFAIGRGQQNQDLALDGSNNVVGNYFLGEIDYRPFGSQWIVSLLGMVGSWDAKINRGYDNGGSTDYSLGQTDIITRSARLRVDAPVLFSVAGFGFSPYASYAVTQTTVDAYTENGGGLPASYDEQQHNATEARLGMMATNVLNAKTKLIISLEGIHRFDGAGPALTGQDITGSVGFSLPGQAPRPDCVRLGVDVDYKLAADTLLNVSAHASTVGEVADVSGAISIRRAF